MVIKSSWPDSGKKKKLPKTNIIIFDLLNFLFKFQTASTLLIFFPFNDIKSSPACVFLYHIRFPGFSCQNNFWGRPLPNYDVNMKILYDIWYEYCHKKWKLKWVKSNKISFPLPSPSYSLLMNMISPKNIGNALRVKITSFPWKYWQ